MKKRQGSIGRHPIVRILIIGIFEVIGLLNALLWPILIGCHSGMGGYQTRPFLMYPAEWPLADQNIVGAENVYKQLKNWLAQYEPAQSVG